MIERRWVRTLNEAHKARYRPVFGGEASHPSAAAVRAFDVDAWENYFKFCFVRNPYERLVSDYFWRRRVTSFEFTFREFLFALNEDPENSALISDNWDNRAVYTIDGKLAVDFVGRVENLELDMATVADRIGLHADRMNLPHSRARRTSGQSSYRDWYGPEERRIVEQIYGDELERFGYTF